jgi:general secretion pathway protein C
MNIDFNKLIQKSIPYTFVILLAYLSATIIFIYLPKTGVDFIQKNSNNSLIYKKYDGFYSTVRKTVRKKEVKKQKKKQTLEKYDLKAIYSTTSNAGWITIEESSNKKSHILSQFDEIDGYLLTKLYKNYVLFEKAAKEYRLDIKQDTQNIKYELEQTVDNIKENLIISNDTVTVKRNYLNSYINDIDKVWNNISINEIKKNGVLDGFKISSVAKKSVFGKLGLKKGDIIKSINNNVLTSYADAFKVYNNINNTKYLNLEILRNNEIMELNYEID